MDGNIRFVTQLKRSDLREIAAATHPEPGNMIRIDITPEKIIIGIDENAFKTAVFGFLRNLGAISVTPSAETIANTPLEPQ